MNYDSKVNIAPGGGMKLNISQKKMAERDRRCRIGLIVIGRCGGKIWGSHRYEIYLTTSRDFYHSE